MKKSLKEAWAESAVLMTQSFLIISRTYDAFAKFFQLILTYNC